MKVTIQPSQLKGTVRAPASKSSMQRACAAALLAKGTTVIHSPGHSNDDRAALGIIQKLGATVEMDKEELTIRSGGFPHMLRHEPKDASIVIDCGESGLSIRMFTPIAALSDKEITITGSGSLLTRPMDFFDEILPRLNVKTRSQDGRLPLTVKGSLRPGNIEIDGSLSSQFLTGLLLAYSASGAKDVTLKVKDLKSRPYIDLTLDVMKRFGFKMPANRNYEEFYFDKTTVPVSSDDRHYTVESDWSGGAFLLVAGAIAGPVMVTGLDPGSTQADKAVLEALMSANAAVAIEAKGIRVHPVPMNSFDFDATDCPDLFPPLVALAAYCKGESKIKGVSRLTHKESNRALTLREEVAKMGVGIELIDDTMIVHGGKPVKAAHVRSHHDHRIAMACAVMALKANGETVIEEAEAVRKSYPDFYHHLRSLGASLTLPFQLIN